MVFRRFAMVPVLIAVFTVSALAVANNGAETISLDGGNRGRVPFPHHRHQDTLKDC